MGLCRLLLPDAIGLEGSLFGDLGGLAATLGAKLGLLNRDGHRGGCLVDLEEIAFGPVAEVFPVVVGSVRARRTKGALGPGGQVNGAVQSLVQIGSLFEEAFDRLESRFLVTLEPLGQADTLAGFVPGDAASEPIELAAGGQDLGLGTLEASRRDLGAKLPVGGDELGFGQVLPELIGEDHKVLFEPAASPDREPLQLEHEALERLLGRLVNSGHFASLGVDRLKSALAPLSGGGDG